MKIKPFEFRRWVHRLNGTAAIILLITGTLVTLPDLRIAIYGSGGKVLSDVHVWTGAVFVSVPLLVLLSSGGSVLSNLKKRIFGSKTVHWRRVHLTVSLFSCFMMGLTGPIMWADSMWELPIALMDLLFLIHLSCAWIVGLTLPLHLWMARGAIVRVSKSWLGLNRKTQAHAVTTGEAEVKADRGSDRDASDLEIATVASMDSSIA